MKKPLCFLGLFLFLISPFYAQIPIGHYYDNNGTPFHGYFDPIEYSPRKQLNLSHQSRGFRKGHYYDKEGNKHNGEIKFDINRIYFRMHNGEEEEKIKAKDVKSFVIEIDSFFVPRIINGYDYDGYFESRIQNRFFQHISETSTLTLAKEYILTNRMQGYFNTAYYVNLNKSKKKDGSPVWTRVPEGKKEFRQAALQYFGHIPYLPEKLENKEFTFSSLLSLVKTNEYFEKYQANEPIYFDKNWQETTEKEKAVYRGDIENLVDSVWTISYYQGDTKLYSGNYTAFLPSRFYDTFTAYYPDGTPRKITLYKANKPRQVTTYFPNGNVHYQYEVFKSIQTPGIVHKNFKIVNTPEGNNLLTSKPFEEHFIDETTGREIINFFKLEQLKYSYHIQNGEKIYQANDAALIPRINKLNTRLSRFKNLMNDIFFDNFDDIQGTIILLVTVDEKGYVSSCKRLNALNQKVDSMTDEFLRTNIHPVDNKSAKLGKYLVNDEPVKYEMVVPLNISITKFLKRPTNAFNYYPDHFMFHQQMMHQNMNIQAPPAIRF
ncbi:MAG: hypothetical protein AAGI07_01365 [Bacteroidota bacterium]